MTYDNLGRIMGITYKTATATLASLAYTRNNGGELTGETSTGLGSTAQTYGYNTISRLTFNGTKVLSYDSADNLTTTSDGATQTYDVVNQVKTKTLGTAVTNFAYE